MIINFVSDTEIPLVAVNIFRTKLDTRPLFLDEEEINVEEQLQAVKQQIMTQPTEVKKSDEENIGYSFSLEK